MLGVFTLATFIICFSLPYLTRRSREAEIPAYAIFVTAFAFALFPFFKSAYALAAIGFLLGLGCGQPMSMSRIYERSPRERVSESSGLRVTVNNFTQLVIPLFFGSLGTAFGYFPVLSRTPRCLSPAAF